MRPIDAFDLCWERYCQARDFLDEKIGTLNLESREDGLWRPASGPKLADYVADFARVGERALSSPRLASRLILFKTYYLGRVEYRRARRHMGISDRCCAEWLEQIREIVGRALIRRGVFPPGAYFREGA